jgi:hypothetical protein
MPAAESVVAYMSLLVVRKCSTFLLAIFRTRPVGYGITVEENDVLRVMKRPADILRLGGLLLMMATWRRAILAPGKAFRRPKSWRKKHLLIRSSHRVPSLSPAIVSWNHTCEAATHIFFAQPDLLDRTFNSIKGKR